MIEASYSLIISIIVVFTLLIFFVWFILKSQKPYPYYSRETLLTKAELKFYKVLKQAIPKTQEISCKVRLADIINCSDINWKRGCGPKISSKHIDFVLFDEETSDIILCIELDDTSHTLPQRHKRDIFVDQSLKTSQIPILRVQAARGYDLAFLNKEIKLAIKKN